MSVTPEARRRSLATVGLMAFARKDYDKAIAAQQANLEEAKAAKVPVEIAMALYNLGNTYLAHKMIPEALETFTEASEGCCHHEIDQLAPMVFCNLGIALFQADRPEEAFESMHVANAMFEAQRNLPGQAHVCDCLAKCHQERGEKAEAEKAWRYALELYESIANPQMQDVRTSGASDIAEKMDRYGYRHGRA